jgi:hypothetical protein
MSAISNRFQSMYGTDAELDWRRQRLEDGLWQVIARSGGDYGGVNIAQDANIVSRADDIFTRA